VSEREKERLREREKLRKSKRERECKFPLIVFERVVRKVQKSLENDKLMKNSFFFAKIHFLEKLKVFLENWETKVIDFVITFGT